MLKILATTFAMLAAVPAQAAEQNNNLHPLFDNAYVNMTYPSIVDGYLVYSQRVKQSSQVMQLQLNNLNATAKDITPSFDKEVVRGGVALAKGHIAYVSNRLQHIAPWLAHEHSETAIATGAFQGILTPNHLDVSADATV